MLSFSEIVFTFGGAALRVWGLLLIIGQLYAAIDVFWRIPKMSARLLAAGQLLLGLFWFCILLDGSYYADWVEKPRVYPFLVELLYASPWITVAAVELVFTMMLALSFFLLFRYHNRHLSRSAIKKRSICFRQASAFPRRTAQ